MIPVKFVALITVIYFVLNSLDLEVKMPETSQIASFRHQIQYKSMNLPAITIYLMPLGLITNLSI